MRDRDPRRDLFQGNYTHSCVTVEARGDAIIDYLLDSGFHIVEVKDTATERTIAQAFLFLVQDEEGRNILVIDNIEVNNNYQGIAAHIRDHLFAYIQRLAEAITQDRQRNIHAIILGCRYNDVNTTDLPKRSLTVRKLGGGAIGGKQYLDAFGSDYVDPLRPYTGEFFVVSEWLNT